MIEGFMITLREGMEAFLIVGLCIAYLRKTGRRHLETAVRWGILVSAVVCAAAGVLLYQVAFNQALWEGVLSLVAAVFVGSLTVHMWRTAKTIKRDIESGLEEASSRNAGKGGWWAVFLFTVLMISREGIETALLLGSLLFQVATRPILIGAVSGVLAAATMAVLWTRFGHRINLSRFFQVTAIFLFVFVAQLLIYSFHELAEASLFPNSDFWHEATEPYGPDGRYGRFITYSLVLLPAAWLLFAPLFSRKLTPRSQAVAEP
ncbi:MAG: FTR1 family protein [Acidobacteriota bacterium]